MFCFSLRGQCDADPVSVAMGLGVTKENGCFVSEVVFLREGREKENEKKEIMKDKWKAVEAVRRDNAERGRDPGNCGLRLLDVLRGHSK